MRGLETLTPSSLAVAFSSSFLPSSTSLSSCTTMVPAWMSFDQQQQYPSGSSSTSSFSIPFDSSSLLCSVCSSSSSSSSSPDTTPFPPSSSPTTLWKKSCWQYRTQ